MSNTEIIGAKIRKYRKLTGISMKELGERIGLSEQAISYYERGKRKISVEIIGKISKVLNVPFEILACTQHSEFSSSISEEMYFDNKSINDIAFSTKIDIRTIEKILNDDLENIPIDIFQQLADHYCMDLDTMLKKDSVFFKDYSSPQLTIRKEKDIQKALCTTLDQLENEQNGLMFDGEPIDDETRELLKISLENSMRLAKQIAKKKYTPNKYKK